MRSTLGRMSRIRSREWNTGKHELCSPVRIHLRPTKPRAQLDPLPSSPRTTYSSYDRPEETLIVLAPHLLHLHPTRLPSLCPPAYFSLSPSYFLLHSSLLVQSTCCLSCDVMIQAFHFSQFTIHLLIFHLFTSSSAIRCWALGFPPSSLSPFSSQFSVLISCCHRWSLLVLLCFRFRSHRLDLFSSPSPSHLFSMHALFLLPSF